MKVICVYNGIDFEESIRLTKGNIYDVVEKIGNDLVFIIDDIGEKTSYFIKTGDVVWFEDATAYIREEKLNKLLL